MSKSNYHSSIDGDPFYEIEYDSELIPGVGRFVLKPQKIEAPENDPIRDLFEQMRNIARSHPSTYDFSRFFERRIRQGNAEIFYEQGMFMKDFTDDFEGSRPLRQYYPTYQMLGYEQLRTFFTWRTKVRQGDITDTSLSYAFLYIYELLNHIGVDDPRDGIEKLLSFWKRFRAFNNTLDKYVLRWMKDYYIYYGLPGSFKDFICENDLSEHYPMVAGAANLSGSLPLAAKQTSAYSPGTTDTADLSGSSQPAAKQTTAHCLGTTGASDSFNLYCSISKYDIKKSIFYTDETSPMIEDCFAFVMERIRQDFDAAGIHFNDALFRPTRRLVPWKPFKNALFFPRLKQLDRRIVLSENEIYICKNNEWTFSAYITTEKGRLFIGFVMKRMEAALRQIKKFKYKLTADIGMVNEDTVRVLTKAGLFIEKIVPDAVNEYYREATKTVVAVDHAALARIRRDALATQEALIVEEQAARIAPVQGAESLPGQRATVQDSETKAERIAPVQGAESLPGQRATVQVQATESAAVQSAILQTLESLPEQSVPAQNPESPPELDQSIFADPADTESTAAPNVWESLKDELSETELGALAVIFRGGDIKAFADEHGAMLEVLMEGINEKAMDCVGDSLMDEDFALYDDYVNEVEELIK